MLGYLEKENCNVFSVDWSTLAAGPVLTVVQNNMPIAGVTVGAFVDYLVQQHATPFDAFHLIGFSLGVIK